MRPSRRRSQPYRKGSGRPKGPTLRSILLGRPTYGPHPSTAKRSLQKRSRKAVR